jgi:outer membrane protein assembly factor BamB
MKTNHTLAVLLVTGSLAASAADWPMWRYDAARSAAAPGDIATNLTLLWSRRLPPVRQAWPQEPLQRLNFDVSYEPVVMGKLLFLASANNGSVTAYDTGTGAERWKVFTEGPIRCAPACWNGRVYAGSDDGYLYCLEAQTGAVVWKFRGAPPDRPDRRQLGNGHLVSFWPVRGGPVIVDGTVYFAAGIWPIFGVFIHAVDAETGKPTWTNSHLNYMVNVRCEHTDLWETGVSPQGHLGVSGDRLFIPCGRAMPAGLNRTTGQLINFDRSWRRGDSRVAAHGEYLFVGRSGMMHLKDFYEFGIRFPMAQALQEYKLIPGCDARSAFDHSTAYSAVKGAVRAYDLTQAKIFERDAPIWDIKVRALTFEPALRWEHTIVPAGTADGLVIKAGRRLYANAGRKLVALENLQAPRVVWEHALPGMPSSLIAADDKLFVATAEGGIYCFGAGPTGKVWSIPATAARSPTNAAAGQAHRLLAAAGTVNGYSLVLGVNDGHLIDGLLQQTNLFVIAVDADAARIDALRRRFDAAGLLGSRVDLFVGNPAVFPFPPYLATLITSENPGAGLLATGNAVRLFNVLRPYGGTLCLDLPPDARASFTQWAGAAGPATVRQTNGCSLLVREGALPGSEPWTHVGADAANTFCSRDDRVRAPLGFLWYGDIPGHPGAGSAFEVNGGRVITLRQQSKAASLFAYDAFTGRPLWQKYVPNTARRSEVATMDDGVYLALSGGQVLVCDPQTGTTRQTFSFNPAGASITKGLRVDGTLLLLACTDTDDSKNFDTKVDGFWDFTTLVCLDRPTGRELWRRTAKARFNAWALAVGGGRVFCADSQPLPVRPKTVPPTPPPREAASTILGLDGRTGAEVWTRSFIYDATRQWTASELGRGGAGSHVIQRGYADDWLAYSRDADTVACGRFLLGNGLDAGTGRSRWENREIRGAAPLIVRGKTLITSNGDIHDLLTGERTANHPEFVHRSGCNYAVAAEHMFLQRNSSAFYYDFDEGKPYQLRNIRSGCFNNMMAGDGLLNVPSTPGCICNFPVQTSFALVTMPEVAAWSGEKPLTLIPKPAAVGTTAETQKK